MKYAFPNKDKFEVTREVRIKLLNTLKVHKNMFATYSTYKKIKPYLKGYKYHLKDLGDGYLVELE